MISTLDNNRQTGRVVEQKQKVSMMSNEQRFDTAGFKMRVTCGRSDSQWFQFLQHVIVNASEGEKSKFQLT